jgi:hypothetical protein
MQPVHHSIAFSLFVGIGLFIVFTGCGETEKPPINSLNREVAEQNIENYRATGALIATVAFDSLRTKLTAAIQNEGTAGAVTYCQVAASQIIEDLEFDEQVNAQEIMVRRTSLKWRSTENKPDDREREVLEQMQRAQLRGDVPGSSAEVIGKYVHYYQPILVQPLCLNCHGTPGAELNEETLATIDVLYPDDRARGYTAGDLRGMWHIVFVD